MQKETTNYDQFLSLDIRVGTILEAHPFPEAKKPAYQLTINFGDIGIKKSSAQITQLYNPESLKGQQILAVVNFPSKQIGKFNSECLVLGIVGESQEVVLLQPERSVKNGLRVL